MPKDTPTYKITFSRIGHNRSAPPLQVRAATPHELADRIGRHAKKWGIRSRQFEVLINPETTKGQIIVGGFRMAGEFTVATVATVPTEDGDTR
jgi:hypothetical protein